MRFSSETINQTYCCSTEADLVAVGVLLGRQVRLGDVLALSGDLGAGKTTLTRGIALGWGALQSVTSPTFILVNEYSRADRAELHHLDCYRLGENAEVESIDLLERLANATPLVIEWAEYVRAALPAETLWIHIRVLPTGERLLQLWQHTATWQGRLAGLLKFRIGDIAEVE